MGHRQWWCVGNAVWCAKNQQWHMGMGSDDGICLRYHEHDKGEGSKGCREDGIPTIAIEVLLMMAKFLTRVVA